MIEAIAGLFAASLVGAVYIYKTKLDADLRDAEDKLKQVRRVKARAKENERKAEALTEAIKNRQIPAKWR